MAILKSDRFKENFKSLADGLELLSDINATTKDGNYVLDPASGGFSILKACGNSHVTFIGDDIEYREK